MLKFLTDASSFILRTIKGWPWYEYVFSFSSKKERLISESVWRVRHYWNIYTALSVVRRQTHIYACEKTITIDNSFFVCRLHRFLSRSSSSYLSFVGIFFYFLVLFLFVSLSFPYRLSGCFLRFTLSLSLCYYSVGNGD